MAMPTFLILGAARSGTTLLYHCLDQHPEVYMSPIKEPAFFAYMGEKPNFRGPGDAMLQEPYRWNFDAYKALFEGVTSEVAIGEASTPYLYSPVAPGNIRSHIPDARFIVTLRNPVERAYSHFLYMVGRLREPCNQFSQALKEEDVRILKRWAPDRSYKGYGLYHSQLSRYLDIFDKSQFYILLFEDLQANSANVAQDLYRFVGVDDTFSPDVTKRHKVGRIPKNQLLNYAYVTENPFKRALHWILPSPVRSYLKDLYEARRALEPVRPLDLGIRKELISYYQEDILRLQDMLQRDLSKWLE